MKLQDFLFEMPQEIKSASEFMKLATEKNFWGAEELHRTRKIIISDIVLT